jgi:hypothetical protein
VYRRFFAPIVHVVPHSGVSQSPCNAFVCPRILLKLGIHHAWLRMIDGLPTKRGPSQPGLLSTANRGS